MANTTSCTGPGQAGISTCPDFMATYCSTDDVFGTYLEKWAGDEISSDCRKYVSLNAGFPERYNEVTDAYVRRYLIDDATPVTFAQQGSLVYQPSIEDVVEVLQDYTGAGDNVLNQFCAGYTREDLSANPNLAKLCGCFMSDEEYDKYTGSFGVEPICDPACVIQSTVKPRDPASLFDTLSCAQTICVIDDVTISVLGQTTTGDINFAQACTACSGNSGCTCSISDVSITAVESTIGNVNFDQNCGGPPTCFQRDASGIPQEVECSALESGGANGETAATAPNSIFSNSTVIIAIGIVVAVIILIILVALFFGRKKSPAPSFEQSRGNGGVYSVSSNGGSSTNPPLL